MANTIYKVSLSANSSPSVTIETDDPAAIKPALNRAKRVLEYLAGKYHDDAEVDEEVQEIEVPLCEVHDLPMVRQQGRYGEFWSCHQRNSDGSFCTFKPSDR